MRGKVFVFLGRPDGGLSLSVKLPGSASLALGLPFAAPTGYGLGKSGWVTARFGPRERPPVALLKQWIDGSYRAVAPKKLAAALLRPPESVAGPGRRGPALSAPRGLRPGARAARSPGPARSRARRRLRDRDVVGGARYPRPPARDPIITADEAARHGFEAPVRHDFDSGWAFTASQYAAFLMTESNVIAAVEYGGEAAAAVQERLESELEPLFAGGSRRVAFTGYVQALVRRSGR